MRTSRSSFVVARRLAAASMMLGGVLAGCNLVLGITEDGLRVPTDAGIEASIDVARARPPLEPCARDTDCIAPNGCYTPHCDTVVGACTYALCEAKGRTCAMGVCNTDTFACSDPLPYTFRTTSYDVPGVTSGCGADPSACVASAFPFVFVGTRDTVAALRADDLVGTQPSQVPIEGLTVNPAQIVASGRRVWVIGRVQGEAPPYQIAIATIDVPSDPTARVLRATTTLLSYPFPTATGFPAPRGGMYLVHNEAPQGFPAALLQPPLVEGAKVGLANAGDAGPAFDGGTPPSPGAITMYRVVAPANSTIAASSGTRLVIQRYPSTFNLVTGAGTIAAVAQPDVALSPALASIVSSPPNNPAASFTQGPDGQVLMGAPVVADPPLPECGCSSNGRLQWVFANAVATATDVAQVIDVNAWYNPQLAGSLVCHQCPLDYVRTPVRLAWIDGKTAMTATPLSGQAAARAVTDVRVVGRDPVNGYPKRRTQTKATESPNGDFTTDRIALTAASGIGYLVMADAQGNDVSLSIFDPRCEAQ